MTSVKAWRIQQGSPSPNILPFPVEASQDIRAGDFVALKSTGNPKATRVVKAQVFTASGLLGIAWHSIKTDAAGAIIPQTLTTVDAGAQVTYPASGYGALVDRPVGDFTGTTPDIGSGRLAVAIFASNLELLMDTVTGGSTAIISNFTQIGKPAGIVAVGTDTKADIGAAVLGMVVSGVAEREPNYNVSAIVQNGLWYTVKPTFMQMVTGLPL